MTHPKRYLTTAQAAERRGRTRQALANERSRHMGPPYIRDGGRVLYSEDELEQWLTTRRVDPLTRPKLGRDLQWRVWIADQRARDAELSRRLQQMSVAPPRGITVGSDQCRATI